MAYDAVTTRQFWQNFSGSNLGYIAELYERFLADPTSVDSDTRAMFETWGAPPIQTGEVTTSNVAADAYALNINIEKVLAAQQLARNIREYGHLQTKLDPLSDKPNTVPQLDMASLKLTEADLESIPSVWIWPDAPAGIRTARDAISRLKEIYTSTLAYDFAHVHNLDEREWLRNRVEAGTGHRPRTAEEKRDLLKRLIEVEEFERYLHKTFVGQKRFSIEGLDMLVPMLDNLVHSTVRSGTTNVFIGMAHRGRLNVLAHVLGKPYAKIFSEFHAAPNKELVPSEGSTGINYGWSGDVKYHLGASKTVEGDDVRSARLTLANNPSHLEFVNPVVEGFTRAAQETRDHKGAPVQDSGKALAVVIHGDAAFPGEGIVQETLNMSHVEGFQVGGTIHIIANNQLGFTAEPNESRSTRYSSDLAKGFEIPIVHVCADDPEACLDAIELAHEYRQTFKKDFLVDLIGFRKWGHNEMDDPSMTQPLRYVKVNSHPGVRTLYANLLKQQGTVDDAQVQTLEQATQQALKDAYNELATMEKHNEALVVPTELSSDATCVAGSTLKKITEEMLAYPETFSAYPKLDRILQRRKDAFAEDGQIDWAHAEALAFATILVDGTPIRLTGQDSERGTFGHRHVILHDVKTGEKYSPLHGLPEAKASFAVHNSPLSEAAIIGFEYGYNIEAPETLVLWEAQFGDFANAGQVLIDQFLSAGYAKWKQPSGLVMLLPHGYEGQGPEHSSARLERYLQMSAEHNWTVVNLSSSAQYFHLLRLQAKSLKGTPRPLIVMTPKSLLRNPKAGSRVQDFETGAFAPVVREPLTLANSGAVTRLVLCSGKVSLDLQGALEKASVPEWLSVARVEQLYPFPEQQLLDLVNSFPKLEEIVWLQEEPRNMGAWTYVQSKLIEVVNRDLLLRYVGRPERSSPAEGFAEVHEATQKQIVQEAITK